MNAFAQTLIVPPHLCYVVLDGQWQIVDHSPPVAFGRWLDPDIPLRDSDIRDHFPELFGCEEIFSDILAGNLPLFTLNGMTRTTATGENFYLDLHLQAAPASLGKEQSTLLILFIEDVTEKMRLEQVLVQSTNEANLLLNALTASKQYIDRIVTAIADALIVTTPHQIIKTVNQATEKLFGYRQEELIGQSLSLLILDAEPLFKELHDSIQNHGELSRNLEVVCQHQSGVKLTVAFSCSLIHTEAQGDNDHHLIPDIVYIGRDVTERQRTQQRLAAQYAIARILSEATTLEAATHQILKAIGENLNWDVGELWLPSTVAERKPALPQPDDMIWQRSGEPCPLPVPKLQRVDFWVESSPTAAFYDFLQATEQIAFPEGVGFAGRVWGAGLPEWITTIHHDPDFGPHCFARQANLCTALGFPLQSGREMLGVMTFFRREQLPPDQNLLQMLAATGNQLGQFMKRKEAEVALQEQQAKTEELLLNILPQPIAERLKVDTTTIADSFEEVTVLFADLVGFTQLAATLPPIAIVEQLNVIFSEFDALTAQYGLEKIKTIGDAYMVVGGLPTPREDHAEAIANLALAMQRVIQELSSDRAEPFALRIGINTGSVVAGVIGTSKFSYDLWGDTVNMASRMESQGLPGRIQVTPNTYHRLKDAYYLTPRGVIPIKGKGEMTTYWLDGYREVGSGK